jgi:hypothetical protein
MPSLDLPRLESEHPYHRCSIRVSRLTLLHCRRLAEREGWETADLARVLICLGGAFSFLALDIPDAGEGFKTLATLGKAARVVDAAIGKPARRPYASTGQRGSELLALRLPQGLSNIVTAYATRSGRSVSHVLGMFLDRGLVIYLKGENALLDAIRSLGPSSAKVSGH